MPSEIKIEMVQIPVTRAGLSQKHNFIGLTQNGQNALTRCE
jgi:hypothetical protein